MPGCCTGSCCASGLLILAISTHTHLKISMCVFQLVAVVKKTARAAWNPQRRPDARAGRGPKRRMPGCCTGSCCASGLLILAISTHTHLKISMCVFQLVAVVKKTARAAWNPQRRPDARAGRGPKRLRAGPRWEICLVRGPTDRVWTVGRGWVVRGAKDGGEGDKEGPRGRHDGLVRLVRRQGVPDKLRARKDTVPRVPLCPLVQERGAAGNVDARDVAGRAPFSGDLSRQAGL